MKTIAILSVFLTAVAGLLGCKSDHGPTTSAPHREKNALEINAWTWEYSKRADGSPSYWNPKPVIGLGATMVTVNYTAKETSNRIIYGGYYPPKLMAEVLSNCLPELAECHQHGIKVIGYANSSWFHPDMMKREGVDSGDLSALDQHGKPVINSMYDKRGVYVSCLNNPKWLKLQTEIIQEAADAGFDGVQFDQHPFMEAPGYNCRCHYCEEEWKKYSKKIFGTEKPMPGKDAPDSNYNELNLTRPEDRQYRIWRHQGLADFLKAIAKHVQRTHPGFLLTLNHVAGDTDYAALSLAGALPIPSTELWQLKLGDDSSLYMYRLTEALSGEKAIGLINSGDQVNPGYRFNVGAAEACAGGGAWYFSPYHKAAFTFTRYMRENQDAYVGTTSEASVGVLYSWHDQEFILNQGTNGTPVVDDIRFRRTTALLARKCVPYDALIMEQGLNAKQLAKYKVIVAPELRLLSEKNNAVLKEYVKSGGHLLAIGLFGTVKEEKIEYVQQPPTLTTWTGKDCEKPWRAELGAGKVANVPVAWKGSGETNMVVSRGFDKAAEELGLYSQLRVKAENPVEATVRGKGNSRFLHLMRFGPTDKLTDRSAQVDYELPTGYHVASATASSPEFAANTLTLNWKESNGRFQADLNQLGNYVLISIKLKK